MNFTLVTFAQYKLMWTADHFSGGQVHGMASRSFSYQQQASGWQQHLHPGNTAEVTTPRENENHHTSRKVQRVTEWMYTRRPFNGELRNDVKALATEAKMLVIFIPEGMLAQPAVWQP